MLIIRYLYKAEDGEMIVIRVELWSARTRTRTELARMHICNTEEGTDDHANYFGRTFKGRSTKVLDKLTVVRTGEIAGWPRHRKHVWGLATDDGLLAFAI